MKTAAIVTGLVAFGVMVSVLLNASPQSGTVVDATTGKPLSGVFVVAIWEASVFKGIESSRTCLKVDVTRTDERGRYSLPWWSWNFVPLYFQRWRGDPWFYIRGYEGRDAQPNDGGMYALVPDTRSAVARMIQVFNQAYRTKCAMTHNPRSPTLQYFREVYQEAKDTLTQKTPEERAIVSNALFLVETLELGFDQAADNLEKANNKAGVK